MRLFSEPGVHRLLRAGFVVGFAMLGALTFLPTFMQFVDGVSATTSGLRTLPMVAGLLITSMGSGVIVGRTGRYKIFPIAGTAVMAVGFLLLSRMDAVDVDPGCSRCTCSSSAPASACACRCSCSSCRTPSSFADLGVATSGVTFFRTIGSSFGAAIFGSLFDNFLTGRLRRRWSRAAHRRERPVAGGAAPAAAGAWPRRSSHAYADSLDLVFLCAAPVAVVGFVVALFLSEVPLRRRRQQRRRSRRGVRHADHADLRTSCWRSRSVG